MQLLALLYENVFQEDRDTDKKRYSVRHGGELYEAVPSVNQIFNTICNIYCGHYKQLFAPGESVWMSVKYVYVIQKFYI